jgi:hypothetical protein
MAASETPAKKRLLLSIICLLRSGFMRRPLCAASTQFADARSFAAASPMKMPATFFRRYRRKVVAAAATDFSAQRALPLAASRARIRTIARVKSVVFALANCPLNNCLLGSEP